MAFKEDIANKVYMWGTGKPFAMNDFSTTRLRRRRFGRKNW